MSDPSKPRRPATFRLDDPGVVVTEADEISRLSRASIQITPASTNAVRWILKAQKMRRTVSSNNTSQSPRHSKNRESTARFPNFCPYK